MSAECVAKKTCEVFIACVMDKILCDMKEMIIVPSIFFFLPLQKNIILKWTLSKEKKIHELQ